MNRPIDPGSFLRGGLFLVGLSLLSGCALLPIASGVRSKALLHDAFHAYETGDAAGALQKIQQALAKAPRKKTGGYLLVELYDDAGLYYYANGRGRESFIHQAVAVLLSQVIETPETMRRFYLRNLGTALQASGLALELADLEREPRRLLEIPEVRDNPHIRLYYAR